MGTLHLHKLVSVCSLAGQWCASYEPIALTEYSHVVILKWMWAQLTLNNDRTTDVCGVHVHLFHSLKKDQIFSWAYLSCGEVKVHHPGKCLFVLSFIVVLFLFVLTQPLSGPWTEHSFCSPIWKRSHIRMKQHETERAIIEIDQGNHQLNLTG